MVCGGRQPALPGALRRAPLARRYVRLDLGAEYAGLVALRDGVEIVRVHDR